MLALSSLRAGAGLPVETEAEVSRVRRLVALQQDQAKEVPVSEDTALEQGLDARRRGRQSSFATTDLSLLGAQLLEGTMPHGRGRPARIRESA